MKIRNKKYTIFIITILLITVIFLSHLILGVFSKNKKDKVIESNKEYLESIQKPTVEEVENMLTEIEKKAPSADGSGQDSNPGLKYQKIFTNSIVVGDSITEGLTAYKFLTDEQVFSKIGASIINGEELFDDAASANPKHAFFTFGVNDMGNYSGDSKLFIKAYKDLLKEFKKKCPKTKIHINGILPPTEAAIANKPIIGNYKEFNTAIKSMCKSEKYQFIDNSSIIEKNPELYAADGIHVNAAFYPLWIENMIEKADMK